MKRTILAAVASAALCLPALAQQNERPGQQPQTSQGTQQQQPNPGQTASQSRGGAEELSSQQLNSRQVREIQQGLDKKGFNVGRVDGIWGPETEMAFKDFQKSQNMPSTGQIDSRSLVALGINVSDFGINAGTTGQAPTSTTGQAPGSGERNAAPGRNAPSDQAPPSSRPNNSGNTGNSNNENRR
jgi:peptidoglycan hydrolase-like protein with peptidoglycan-binding domain